MNKSDLKMLAAILAQIEEAKETVETIRDAARETFDNRSEKWQESDKGQEASEECDRLDALCDALDSAVSEFGNFELN